MILYPGTMLQDRYEILEKIGSGGMSDVYKAKCHKLNRLVAIKVLKSEFTSDATFVSKFKMEAQAAAGLSHPNIVNIYDVVDEGDIHFIVMELVEGITLKSYITKKGHLEVKEAIGIAIQVASGIEAAHEQHIIHRDIKPQNMLISMDGKVKVADFGIARAVSSQTMNAATVVGSVHYISPEQENSDGVEKGMVISQKEKPDTVIPRFSKVTVVISAGSDKVDLAELGLSGMTLETAVRLLEGKNLKADVQEESSEDVPSGTIIRYEPEDKVALGSTVTLYVSTGPEEEFVSVPNLYGKTDAEASALLSAAGLVAGEISKEYDSTISAGHVISQGVEAGTQIAPGETVDYTVSLGPEAPKKQFIASLDASYPLQVSYGPGAASSEIQILIRLKQTVNGKVTYTKLAEPKSYSADTTLNIKLDKIRGADGVQTGEVEIVDLTNNVVLTSYNVTFTEVDS